MPSDLEAVHALVRAIQRREREGIPQPDFSQEAWADIASHLLALLDRCRPIVQMACVRNPSEHLTQLVADLGGDDV